MRLGHDPPHHFLVQPVGQRPDFRLLIDFLGPPDGLHTNIDTDGDSDYPARREWTYFRCDGAGAYFEVKPLHASPFTWCVWTETLEVEARVAYFLATETGSAVTDVDTAERYPPAWLLKFMGDFNLAAATARAARSCWRRSTLEDPYPLEEP